MAQNDPIASLIALLSRLPGVGERTAARLAFHVLEGDVQYAQALGLALSTIHDDVTRCELCGPSSAEARCSIPRVDGDLDYAVDAHIFDAEGVEVATVRALWRLSPVPERRKS